MEDEVSSFEPAQASVAETVNGVCTRGAVLSAKASQSPLCAVRSAKPCFWGCGGWASLWTEFQAAGRLPCVISRAS